MSTRAQICIKLDTAGFAETGGIYIYKHCDGYPSGVLPTLAPFVAKFIKERGYDPSYLLCQIVRAFAVEDFKRDGEGYTQLTGWGLDNQEHGDIQYLYEVDSHTGEIYINGKKWDGKMPKDY